MKKKILSGFAILAIAVGAAFNMNIDSNEGLSDVSLANVEALAITETGCPNGCTNGGGGCYCFAEYKDLREYDWDKNPGGY